MANPKRKRPVCGYLGCTRDEYHAGICFATSLHVKRRAPIPRRIASTSMSTDPPVKTVPISTEVTTERLMTLTGHSIGDLLFTIDEVQQLIDML